MDTRLTIIGHIRSPYTRREECPKQAHLAAPPSQIKLLDAYLPAAEDLEPGQEVIVLTWLHEADRRVLRCHPRGDENLPRRGVFATRSPDRPNPIGLHPVTVIDRKDALLTVHPLEVLDGTPVLDIKPRLWSWNKPLEDPPFSLEHGREIRDAARDGWRRGLLSGCNGNISRKSDGAVLMTASGAAKGRLTLRDIAVIDAQGNRLAGPAPSTEYRVHLAVYAARPEVEAVVHTHPPCLLAVSILRGLDVLRDLPFFEAAVLTEHLRTVSDLPPGGDALAEAVFRAAPGASALFLKHHGLVSYGPTLSDALARAEALEDLARIALLAP